MDKEKKGLNGWVLFGIFVSWLIINEFPPYLNRLINLRKINPNIWPAVAMTLMLLATYAYIKYYEKKKFLSGFNLNFQKIGKNLLWAFIFFNVALAIEAAFQFLIIIPLTQKSIVPSGETSREVIAPLLERLIEYVYVVYEGLVEVLVFIGFLFDRLERKWNWKTALITSNIGFALWHYNYWSKGWLEGTLMVIMVFFVGMVITLSYWKTNNSLSPLVCHTLVDLPSEIRHLLGVM